MWCDLAPIEKNYNMLNRESHIVSASSFSSSSGDGTHVNSYDSAQPQRVLLKLHYTYSQVYKLLLPYAAIYLLIGYRLWIYVGVDARASQRFCECMHCLLLFICINPPLYLDATVRRYVGGKCSV